ncbi:MAG: hypothetical protein KC994_05845, partial [Candidatus Omnitrophica bacterium]|nr:hypothetical protein [Candidatus Omnitrophota bacterium]
EVVLILAIEGVGPNDLGDNSPIILDPRPKKFFATGVLYRFRFLSPLYVTRNEDFLQRKMDHPIGEDLEG